MAHPEQRAFCESVKQDYPQFFANRFVIDIGSLDVNGNNQYLFENCLYLGVDLMLGPNVDLATKAHELNFPDESIDVVISTECFEHDQHYEQTLKNILRMIKPGGGFIFTCATTGREEHGTRRTTPMDAPFIHSFGDWTDYYKNLEECDFRHVLDIDAIFHSYAFVTNAESHDLYFWGIKKGKLHNRTDYSFQIQPHIRELQITGLNQTIAERDSQIEGLNQTIAERDSQIEGLNQTIVKRDSQIEQLTSLNQAQQDKLLKISLSNSIWLTKPLREIRRWFSTPGRQTTRYIRRALRLAKGYYQKLPLSQETKSIHRNFIAKYAPKIILNSYADFVTIERLGASCKPLSIKANDGFATIVLEYLMHATTIILPISKNPMVSVIIPIYGQIEFTLRCLISITKNLPKASFEIIILNDCSSDNSIELLSNVQGIRLISNSENQGFILSCNRAACEARGNYLYFLNNDTEVTPGWLDELLQTFYELPGVGLVGSMLIYPDGRLQEAGGIIWQDGSSWNFGKFQDQSLPVYNYAREVDYCSGASIMVPKALFTALGGFDEHYLPAYCEDADLALKIRDKGYRVIYQPLSKIIHYEGVTSGTDTTQGIKAYQVENTKKLFERWRVRLQRHQPNGINVDVAKDRRASRRLLAIDHCTPTPDQDAGSVTMFNLLLLLRDMDFQITFIPEDNFAYLPDYTPALQRLGIEVLYTPETSSVVNHLKSHGFRYDLILLVRPKVATRYIDPIRKYCPNLKILYLPMDLHFLRMSREVALQFNRPKETLVNKMMQQELEIFSAVDASMVHSDIEIELLRSLIPEAKLYLLPLIMDKKGTEKSFTERQDIIFIGGYQHSPNVDAVQYFVKETMPILRKKLPGVCLYIVGSKPPAEVQALACGDIFVTGYVKDLTLLLDKMRVSIAPLRYGAGVKGKIGTALASGLPVVATSIAAEGMFLTDHENILVADSPDAFAAGIVELYQNKKLWDKISKNGLIFSDKTWGKEAIWSILSEIIVDLGIMINRSQYPLSLYSIMEGSLPT